MKGLLVKEFFLSIVSGVSAAISFAIIVWIFTSCKNLRLKQTIKSSIEGISFFESVDGIGMVLQNKTHVSVIIRSVQMILTATEEHQDLKKGERSGFFTLNYNGPSEFGSKREFEKEGDSRNFVEIPAYTSGRWIVPLRAFVNSPFLKISGFDGCEITLEYLTLNKNPKIVTVKVKGMKHSSGVIYAMEKKRQDIIANGIESYLPPWKRKQAHDSSN